MEKPITHISYYDCSNLTEQMFQAQLVLMPRFLKEKILRYRFRKDQATSLMGKILLRNALIATDFPAGLLNQIEKNKNEKPFISAWKQFNISHSGRYVIFAYSDTSQVGIDIEKIDGKFVAELDDMTYFFCQDEQDYIQASDVKELAFFDLWARKEAILKAIGVGLPGGLNSFDCRTEAVVFETMKWHLQELNIDDEFKSYIATEEPCDTKIQEFILN